MVKKISLCLLVLILFCLNLTGCKVNQTAKDASFQKIQKKGFIVLGVNDSIPPFSFIDRNEQKSGFDIELIQEIANRMGVELKYKTINQKDGIKELKNNNIDLLNGVILFNKINNEIVYSNTYINIEYICMVRKDSDILALDNIKNKRIGIQEEIMNHLDSKENKILSDNEIITYSTKQEAMIDLGIKKIDVVIIDEWFAKHLNVQRPSEFKWLNEIIYEQPYGIALNIKNVELKQEVDRIINDMMNDGFIDTLFQKWFGENMIKQ